MYRCAVLGSPIAHSLSPLVHRTAYAQLGLVNWRYDAYEVDEGSLGDFIASCDREWVGLSCTMPLKSALLAFGEPSKTARALASGNTYLFARDGSPARVENTDVSGIVRALLGAGVADARTALVLGAGATARSALYALAGLGVDDVLVLARDEGRARASLEPVAGLLGQTLEVQTLEVPDTQRRDVLINSVPAALPPGLASGLVAMSDAVFDLIYGHGPSQFGPPAAASGIVCLDGLDMLVGQAVDQIRLMTGRDCPSGPLLAACRREVDRRAAR